MAVLFDEAVAWKSGDGASNARRPSPDRAETKPGAGGRQDATLHPSAPILSMETT